MDNDALKINYEKRKNTELFKLFQKDSLTFLSEIQNYIPIYTRFFLLNDTNYNSVNLNHKWFLTEIKSPLNDENNLYSCTIQNLHSSKTKKKQVFFKMAPLLDPFKYLIGKYNTNDATLFNLPKLTSGAEIGSVQPKLLDYNNSAYVDGFFSFLSSTLIHKYKFVNGVDYYGSFIGIKNQFKINIIDDLDYLCKSDYFNKNKNIAFQVDDYSFLFDNEESKQLVPIKINAQNISNKSNLSIKSIENDLFDDLFIADDGPILGEHLSLDDLKENSVELIDIMDSETFNTSEIKTSATIKSNSTCSSRTSHTSDNISENFDTNNSENSENSENSKNSKNSKNSEDCGEDCDEDCEGCEKCDEDSDDCEEQRINAIIPRFPVQVICMEHCETTFDDLIIHNDLTHDEWFSALMQIIMILITYQKAFAFTHNDLHTNNIMYTATDEKFIYYCYKKTYYKVPTFGRIFKIIDFGRAIYKFNGKIFCSDSFQPGSDAATQYNTEPYFNEKKPRLEPNYSFDLCRLACSIFDYVIDDMDDIEELDKCEPIVRLIYDWCLDDSGLNILYKNNGVERYPDFKLYKMIARCVHNHTPQAQLDRKEFKHFVTSKNNIASDQTIINIDSIPAFSSE